MEALLKATGGVVYSTVADLPVASHQEICHLALRAREHAYVPYSHYAVGTGILMREGQVLSASNHENAVYPLGLCAERVGMYAAHAMYPGAEMEAMAIATFKDVHNPKDVPAFPCGSCRQTLLEHETRFGSRIRLYILQEDNQVFSFPSVSALLPFAFDVERLSIQSTSSINDNAK